MSADTTPGQYINLMPRAYMQRLGDHRERRRFVLHAVIAMICVTLLAVERRTAVANRTNRIVHVQQQVQSLQEIKAVLDETNDEISAITEEIATYQRIALPIDMSRVIATLSGLMPEELTVSSMRLWVEEVQESRSTIERIRDQSARQRKASMNDTESHRYLRGEFEGTSVGGRGISDLLERLEEHPLFSRVQLDYSRAATSDAVQVRDFRINFSIDLEVRYLPSVAATSLNGEISR